MMWRRQNCALIYGLLLKYLMIFMTNKLPKRLLKANEAGFVDIPQNPVYDAVRLKLQPLLHSMMLQWQAANSIEENKSDLNKSYMLRAYFSKYHNIWQH